MTIRRFELEEDGSRKFWEAGVEGAVLTVRFGRLGTDGQTKPKTFADPGAAEKELAKLIAEKTKKGYREVGAPGSETPAAIAPSASAVDAPAAEPSAKKRTKPAAAAAWKPLTVAGRHLGIAPSGAFVVVGSAPIAVDGTYRMSLTIHERGGKATQVPVPGAIGGIAVTSDDRIVVSLYEDYPSRTPRTYDQAGLALYDASGRELGRVASPELAGAGAIAIDSRGRVAVRLRPMHLEHPRYLKSKLAWTTVDAIARGEPVHQMRDFGGAPVFGFDESGALFGLGGVERVRVDPSGEVTTLPRVESHTFTAPDACPDGYLGPSASGGRIAAVAFHERAIVLEGDECVLALPEHLATWAFLVEGGKTLITAANKSNARLGPSLEPTIVWPDPMLRDEHHIAVWDAATGALRKVLPLAGTIGALVLIEGQWIATSTVARSHKVEVRPWSALLG